MTRLSQDVVVGSTTVAPLDARAAGADWDALVRETPDGTPCHLSGWARVVERTWGHRPAHLGAWRDGRLVGVLPLFEVRSPFLGARLVSSPNAVYGGSVALDAEAHAALLSGAKRAATRARVRYLELRDRSVEDRPDDPELLGEDLYVSFDHELTLPEDRLLRGFPADVRRMIRQATERHGLRAEVGHREFLDPFYDVYAASVRNLGTPVFPKRLFAAFLDEFAGASDILLVRQGDAVAGGVLTFYFGETAMPYYGGAYRAMYGTGVNNFMYWELMRRCAARGLGRFDFGRSKRGTGAYHFKRGWRMRERPLAYRQYLVTSTRRPQANPTNPRLRLLIDAWRRLPLPITRLIGPAIVRHLP
jgi:FemAB-related protein (PEP-CTERM system-associated)